MTTTFFMPPSARVCRSARQRKAGPVQDARRRTARRQAQVPDKHVTNRLNLPHKESRKTRRVGGPKFRSFFLPLLPQISFFSSLSWWSSRGILVVFLKRWDPQMCTERVVRRREVQRRAVLRSPVQCRGSGAGGLARGGCPHIQTQNGLAKNGLAQIGLASRP